MADYDTPQDIQEENQTTIPAVTLDKYVPLRVGVDYHSARAKIEWHKGRVVDGEFVAEQKDSYTFANAADEGPQEFSLLKNHATWKAFLATVKTWLQNNDKL